MNVLLVQAYLGGNEQPVFPIGLGCLASSIRGHDVRVFDPNVSEDPFGEFSDMLAEFRPDVIGISIRNIDSTNKRDVVFYYPYVKDFIDVVKISQCGNSKIIVGGSGFSMFAQEIMQDEPRIDYGVFLEGEITFQALLEHLEHPDAVKGVYFRRNGTILFTGLNDQVDLNVMEPPDWTSIGVRPYQNVPDAIGIETKRGCRLGCVYCIYGFLNGRNYRLKDPVRVVNEIETLNEHMKVESFTFVDSVFNVPLSHAEAICKEIIRRGIKVKWSAWFHENYLTKEFVDLARDAGCNKIILSPDGFSDNVLSNLGKTIKKHDILNVFSMLKNIDGFEICYNFFKNPPGQTLCAFLGLMLFCIKAKLILGNRVHFEFSSIRIEPHTGLSKIALEEGLIEKGDNLLSPKYYTNRNTLYIDRIFNAVLSIKGKLI